MGAVGEDGDGCGGGGGAETGGHWWWRGRRKRWEGKVVRNIRLCPGEVAWRPSVGNKDRFKLLFFKILIFYFTKQVILARYITFNLLI